MTITVSREKLILNNNKLLIEEGFNAFEINQIKNNIEIINSAVFNIGNSILDIAKSLSEIKKCFKNNKWIEITDSGIFNLSGRTCRDFASAYDSWLFESKIPDNILAELSARSLAKIGKFDLIKKNQIINRLLNGEIFTESDLIKFSSEKKINDFDYNRQVKKAIDICHSLTDAQKLRNFENIMIINVKQKEEIINLKKTILELEKK